MKTILDTPGSSIDVSAVQSIKAPSAVLVPKNLNRTNVSARGSKTISPQTSDGKKGSQKNLNFCYYCETLVFDFSRHVMRNHSSEIFVQRIIASKKGDKRNNLLSKLRKKGNYINASCGEIKPVKNC